MRQLTEAERKRWQDALDARTAELASELRDDRAEDPADPRALLQDNVDIADGRLGAGVRQAERDRDAADLRAIDAARGRLEAGEFGACVDCGVEIPRARLEAMPSAARCIECQERHEQTHPPGVRLPPVL